MIFLSAQPDNKGYLWQLEVQLHNFNKFGIKASDIHVLIAYRSKPSKDAVDFKEKYRARGINVCLYPDTRTNKGYISSIRPHIIKKHYAEFPELYNEAVFYHDNDVIFVNSLPKFDDLLKDNINYVSSTKNIQGFDYLDIRYIKSKGGLELIHKMAKLVDVDTAILKENDLHVGGAQYIIKGINLGFWDKIEDDCNKLYPFLLKSVPYFEKWYYDNGGKDKKYNHIQHFCTDMWVLLWNLWDIGLKTRVHPELNFSFGSDLIKVRGHYKIMHNAGVTRPMKDRMFYKGEFKNKDPFSEDFSYVSDQYCNYLYVKEIKEFIQSDIGLKTLETNQIISKFE